MKEFESGLYMAIGQFRHEHLPTMVVLDNAGAERTILHCWEPGSGDDGDTVQGFGRGRANGERNSTAVARPDKRTDLKVLHAGAGSTSASFEAN